MKELIYFERDIDWKDFRYKSGTKVKGHVEPAFKKYGKLTDWYDESMDIRGEKNAKKDRDRKQKFERKEKNIKTKFDVTAAANVYELLYFTRGEFTGKFPECPEITPKNFPDPAISSDKVVKEFKNYDRDNKEKESIESNEYQNPNKQNDDIEKSSSYFLEGDHNIYEIQSSDEKSYDGDNDESSCLSLDKEESIDYSDDHQTLSDQKIFYDRKASTPSNTLSIPIKTKEIENNNIFNGETQNSSVNFRTKNSLMRPQTVSPSNAADHKKTDKIINIYSVVDETSTQVKSHKELVFSSEQNNEAVEDLKLNKNTIELNKISVVMLWKLLQQSVGVNFSDKCYIENFNILKKCTDLCNPFTNAKWKFLWKKAEYMNKYEKTKRKLFFSNLIADKKFKALCL